MNQKAVAASWDVAVCSQNILAKDAFFNQFTQSRSVHANVKNSIIHPFQTWKKKTWEKYKDDIYTLYIIYNKNIGNNSREP